MKKGIVVRVFDNKVEILTEANRSIMNDIGVSKDENDWYSNDKVKVNELFRNGQVVRVKKNIFGNYKFNKIKL